tara:strand:+ start:672 stop:965 length:294 start_codon:yes stop_codon:yes gene_type:complete
MMTETQEILESLGLTPEEVRAAFGVTAPKKKAKPKGYLFRHDQVRMNKRMRDWEGLIYARYVSGMHPKTIAGCLGVSEETVRVRLRKSGFFDRDFRT